MSESERIKALEDMVFRLKIETLVLKSLMVQQIGLNNITYKGKYDEVIIKMAKDYELKGLDDIENKEAHETLRSYLKQSEQAD